MAMRNTLLKGATSNTTVGTSLYPRISRSPYLFVSAGGYSGTVKAQVSVSDPAVADSAAEWIDVGDMANGSQLSWHDPIFRVRGNASGLTGGAAYLYMLEEVSDRIEK